MKKWLVIFFCLAGVRGVGATNIPEVCVTSPSEVLYNTCWREEVVRSSCVIVRDSETGEIDNNGIFCNTLRGDGRCQFKGAELNCQRTLNPVQEGVYMVSARNQAIGKLKYEVMVEPGEVFVEEKASLWTQDRNKSGLVSIYKTDDQVIPERQ